MSKKDYVLIAKALKHSRLFFNSTEPSAIAADTQWVETVCMLEHYLAKENPRFDRVRFVEGCGIDQS